MRASETDTSDDWSTEQLAEFMAGIAGSETSEDAIQEAVKRTAQVVGADLCAYVREGEIHAFTSLEPDSAMAAMVIPLADGEGDSLEAAGLSDSMVVPVVGDLGGAFVLARAGKPFAPTERALVRAMGGALSLSTGKIQTIRAERERWSLLTKLSMIQRSISHHAPLQEVLDAISRGASELLDEPVAGVSLIDRQANDQIVIRSLIGVEHDLAKRIAPQPAGHGAAGRAIDADAVITIEDLESESEMNPWASEAGVRAAIAAPIREGDAVAGALVVGSPTRGRRFSEPEHEALTAFADHASLALTDARLTDQVERALHDPLTGLPNRFFLSERLAERLAAGSSPAVIALDLDRFRAVNDRVGHAGADQMLVELGRRLRKAAGADAVVARLDGDCFAVLSSVEQVHALAGAILEVVAEPFNTSGRQVRMTASIGVVDSGSDAEQMLRDGDLAMYRAKGVGGARNVTFEAGMHTELMEQMELQDDLARAIEEGEITAYFQPKVDLRSAHVVGVEALARWVHPDRGVVPPGDFLQLAEASGHMRTLTERVIEFSARVAGDWWLSGLGLQLSVNLSPSTFSEPGWQLDRFVAEVLDQAGLPGNALQFELTEDSLMLDPDEAAMTLRRLSDLGASVSIDDFGTGHSSLGRLSSLPIDELKIDRSFILDMTGNEEDRTIVRSTIHLAHQMGLQVTAEGVETEEIWRQLRSMGCERAQGFLIAKPLPAREIPAWLASWNQRARELRTTSQTHRVTPTGKSKKSPGRPEKASA